MVKLELEDTNGVPSSTKSFCSFDIGTDAVYLYCDSYLYQAQVLSKMSDSMESIILTYLSASESTVIEDTFVWSNEKKVDHNEVVGTVKSLEVEAYVAVEPLKMSFWSVTKEGNQIITNGSPEVLVWNAIKCSDGGLTVAELQKGVGKDVAKVGMGNCMKNKWVKKDGDKLISIVNEVKDDVQSLLKDISSGESVNEKAATNLKKRKLVTLQTRKSYKVSRGKSYAPTRVKKAADLTKEMLDSGSWKTTPFKPYNLVTLGEPVGGGYLHPLLKVRAEFRTILMQMGFSEMPTNKWVESSFWNFDSLFQPQSHPARDAHDTFFISSPAATLKVPEDYYEKVKTVHEKGGYESIGYRYDFQRAEAEKNLLRTHTTAISAQMLYQLGQKFQNGEDFQPVKYFSIDRVFRNETMDATHLCEFHQVEGLVADYDLSLGDLIGTIQTFFHKIGIDNVKFKPAFNPYTEPSLEIFGYHPDLKKWTEIGNSGMFRPEMLRPMGLPENVRVIAWGLSLERPTMIKYRMKNIRDLFGHKVDLGRTRSAPICRFNYAE